jgi:hypothetical protein
MENAICSQRGNWRQIQIWRRPLCLLAPRLWLIYIRKDNMNVFMLV